MTTFRLPAPDLLAAITWVERCVPSRPPVPVLGGALVEASGDRVTVSGFDYDLAGTTTVTADVTEPGRFLVSARLLSSLAKAAGNSDATVTVGASHATVEVGRSSWRLPLLPVDDYPALPDLGEPVGSLPGDVFAATAARVLAAVGRDQTVPMLTGVKLTSDDDGLTWAATDRHRLGAATVAWDRAGDDVDVLVPSGFVELAARIAAGRTVTLYASEHGIGVTAGSHRLTGRLLDAQFPRWRQLMPADVTSRFVDVDVDALRAAVSHAAALGGMQLHLTFGPDAIVLADPGQEADGQATHAECPVERLQGEPMTVGVSTEYLLAAVGSMPPGSCRIVLGEHARKPILFGPVQPDGHQHLFMPARIAGAE